MQRFSLPALEYHVAHGCNLSCQQCSHYSNFRLAGRLPTLADAESEYSQWSHRLKPRDSHCWAVSRCSILRSWSTFNSLDNTGTTVN